MASVTNLTNITNIINPDPSTSGRYCYLDDFAKTYREMHGYFSILVCVFGSVANVLNICVLSTREMRWPTNFILTGLAVADLLVMLDYIPFAIHFYFDPGTRLTANYFVYSWAIYVFFHALFAQACHFISCCLTLILAVWRYIAVKHPQRNLVWCNADRTKLAIILTYVFCPVMCFPIYMSLKIISNSRPTYNNGTLIPEKLYRGNEKNFSDYRNQTIYFVHYSEYQLISFLVYGVVLKLVPCIILVVISKQLISAVIAAQKRRYNLLSNNSVPLENLNGKTSAVNQRLLEKEQQTDRTTRMLLAVLLLFLLTEFPQAISGLLSAIIGRKFETECHRPLGTVDFDPSFTRYLYPEINTVVIVNTSNWSVETTLTCDAVQTSYSIVQFSPCGNFIAAASDKGDLVVWEVSSQMLVDVTNHPASTAICTMVWNPSGDLFDIFALTNCAINFILYCTMSRQFRTAFRKLFEKTIFNRVCAKICTAEEKVQPISSVTNV